MWSLFTSLELSLIHVHTGVEPARALFPFFFRCEKSPSRGAKCKKNTLFFLCISPAFTFKHRESQRRS